MKGLPCICASSVQVVLLQLQGDWGLAGGWHHHVVAPADLKRKIKNPDIKWNKENRLKNNIPHTLEDVSRQMRKRCWETHKGIYWIYFHSSSDISGMCSVSNACWSCSLQEAISHLFFSLLHRLYSPSLSLPTGPLRLYETNTFSIKEKQRIEFIACAAFWFAQSHQRRWHAFKHRGGFQPHSLYFSRHCQVCVCVSFTITVIKVQKAYFLSRYKTTTWN